MSKAQASSNLRAPSFSAEAALGSQPRAPQGASSYPPGPGQRARRRVPAGGVEPPPLPSLPAPLQTSLGLLSDRPIQYNLPLRANQLSHSGTHYVFGVKRYQHLKPHCPLGPKSL